MPRNVELKARATHPRRQRELAASLAEGPPEVLRQEDFFFPSPAGRLKLRVFSPARGELIQYQRENHPGPKPSEYSVVPTDAPLPLRELLERALGLRGIVRKTRTLFLPGRTRIHLDEVDGLGSFIELEVVLSPGESAAEGAEEARRIAGKLEVKPGDGIDSAYIDLLEAGGGAPGLLPR
jgi:adenylate cyclase class IV